MKKKLLALVLVIVLGVTSVVGGTLAYLQDDDSAVNVMTLGNVYIEQLEYERADGVDYNATASKAENTLVPYTQGQSLYPAVPNPDAAAPYQAAGTDDMFYWGDYVFTGTSASGLWNDANLANVMDKMVFVKNTGTSDLYFRTIIAFEHPEGTTFGDAQQGHDIGFNGNGYGQTGAAYKWTGTGTITVDGVRYAVYEALYDAIANGNGILKPGQTSHPSLLQVVMHHSLDNEDVAKYGETYDILVLSQAIQTEGFPDAQTALDTGFGKTSEKAAEWFGGMKAPTLVDNADELTAALEAGKDVTLTKDMEVTEAINVSGDVTIDLNGYDLDASKLTNDRPFHMTEGANLTINGDGETVTLGAHGLVNVPSGVKNASITLNGGTYTGTTANGAMIRLRSGNEKVDVVLNNVTYTDEASNGYIVSTSGFNGEGTFTVNGGSYSANYGFQLASLDATLTGVQINTDGTAVEAYGANVVVDGCTITVDPGVTVVYAPGSAIAASGNGTATVKNCKITGSMQAVYYVYNSGGTIVAEGNDITGVTSTSLGTWRNDATTGKIVIDGVTVSPEN